MDDNKYPSGIHTGDLMGIPPTGKEVTMGVMDIFRIVNEKIVAFSLVSDQLSMMQQLGVLPAAAPA